MFDNHTLPSDNWGILPSINFFGLNIPSYSLFVFLGLVVGISYYLYLARKEKKLGENGIYIVLAALVGGALGAKIPYWIAYFPEIISSYPNIMPFLSGRTIVGGLIGGFLGVLFIKKKLGITDRRGNLFVPAIALGVAIGRIGCFLAGCCYGVPTGLPWGVNFGDGVLRHPTQLYESIYMIILFIYFNYKRKQNPKPGQLFSEFIIAYFSFRFIVSFIRAEPVFFLGLDFFQWVSLGAVILFSIREFNILRKSKI